MKTRKVRALLFMLTDIGFVIVSILLAYGLRFDFSPELIPDTHAQVISAWIVLSVLVKIPIYWFSRLYNSIWKYAGIPELFFIASAATISNLVMMALSLMLQLPIPRSIFLLVLLLDAFFLALSRFSYRILRRIKLGLGLGLFHKRGRQVMVVGAGEAGATIIREMQAHPELNLVPVAVVDDDPAKKGLRLYGVPVLGNRSLIPDLVEQQAIEEVIIAIPNLGRQTMTEIFELCSSANCTVKALPSVSQLIDETVLIQQVRNIEIEDLLGRDPVQLDLEEIDAFIKGKKVLVTGAGGSIGSELTRQLALYQPASLVLLDNYENNLFELTLDLKARHSGLNLVSVVANIRDGQRMNEVMAQYRPTMVFHAAAHKHVPLMEDNPGEAIKNNIFGTLNVARAAMKYKVKRFVLISTDKAVNPTNIMGASKRVAEMIIQTLNRQGPTEFTAVRFGNVLGSNGSVIPTFQKQIAEGGPVTVTHKDITRYFMLIPEAAQLVIQAGTMAKGGEIFVLDMGKPVKIYDLAKQLIRLSGYEPEKDIEIVFTGLRPGEKLYEELLMAEEGLEATKNEKIFVLQPCDIEAEFLWATVDRLERLANQKGSLIFKELKELVPTLHREDTC